MAVVFEATAFTSGLSSGRLKFFSVIPGGCLMTRRECCVPVDSTKTKKSGVNVSARGYAGCHTERCGSSRCLLVISLVFG